MTILRLTELDMNKRPTISAKANLRSRLSVAAIAKNPQLEECEGFA